MSVQFLVILVPVVLALMGFAVDLGQLYLIKGELQAAANAAALAAGQKLIGTDASTTSASDAMRLTLENTTGFGNKYNFGALPLGETTGFLSSEVPDPGFFETASDATAGDQGAGTEVSGSSARYARVTITADAPLTFWSFLPLAQERKTSVRVQAVAGMSAPLCVACAIEPLAIAALDASDTVDFGFTRGIRYTLGYQCNGGQQPAPLANTAQRIPYLILNKLDDSSTLFPDENQQLYRIGAGGLIPSATNSALACVSMNPDQAETMWVTAAPQACANPNGQGQVASQVTSMACGLASRFDASAAAAACPNITDVDTIVSAFQADTDINDLDDYAAYVGNGRRVITVPVVQALSTTDAMIVLGFRQFLIEPNQDSVNINPADNNARFGALYIGAPMPLKQGRMDGCPVPQQAGPGKVVLHQ